MESVNEPVDWSLYRDEEADKKEEFIEQEIILPKVCGHWTYRYKQASLRQFCINLQDETLYWLWSKGNFDKNLLSYRLWEHQDEMGYDLIMVFKSGEMADNCL